MVGTWDVSLTFWTKPGAPPLSTTGTSTIRSLLGGLFVEETIEGTLAGAPFTTMAWTVSIRQRNNTRRRASQVQTRAASPKPASTTRRRDNSN
jgi:hypothetical protein